MSDAPKFSRKVSNFSEAALNQLSTLEQEMFAHEEQVTLFENSIEEVKAAPNELRQACGNLENFQYIKVDAIITADLTSGKDEAKARRKAINARCDAVRERQQVLLEKIKK